MNGPTQDEVALALIKQLRRERDEALALNADLLDALTFAVQVIRDWHSIGMTAPVPADEAWTLYQQSPEMQRLNAALAKAEGRS